MTASSDRPLLLDDFIPFRLSFTSNLVSDTIARSYESLFGLSIPEWRLVAVIAETGGITQAEIGHRTRMDKVTVSRAAIALLMLSDAGRTLYAAVAPKARDLEARIFAQFDPAEVAAFTAMLRRIDAVTSALDQPAQGGDGVHSVRK
jgi:DNA-binding MarR family transcriptional regulator